TQIKQDDTRVVEGVTINENEKGDIFISYKNRTFFANKINGKFYQTGVDSKGRSVKSGKTNLLGIYKGYDTLNELSNELKKEIDAQNQKTEPVKDQETQPETPIQEEVGEVVPEPDTQVTPRVEEEVAQTEETPVKEETPQTTVQPETQEFADAVSDTQ